MNQTWGLRCQHTFKIIYFEGVLAAQSPSLVHEVALNNQGVEYCQTHTYCEAQQTAKPGLPETKGPLDGVTSFGMAFWYLLCGLIVTFSGLKGVSKYGWMPYPRSPSSQPFLPQPPSKLCA